MATAWTNPPTFVDGNPLPATTLNATVRDDMLHLYQSKGNVRAIVTKTTPYTLTAGDGIVMCNGTFTVTVPTPATFGATTVFTIKNIGSSGVTTINLSGQTADGRSSWSLYNQYDYITIATEGGAWYVVAERLAVRRHLVTGTDTVDLDDDLVECFSATPFTLTLHATNAARRRDPLTIVNTGAGVVTVVAADALPISNGSNLVLAQFDCYTLERNLAKTVWIIT
jgi:hypothetical protein